jgi:hypothetical protein
MPLGFAAAAVLLLAAIFKPWSAFEGARAALPAPGATSAVLAASAAGSSATPSAAPMLCDSPDGWRVVTDDVEFGRPVRTWFVADAVFSAVTPAQSIVPVATVLSSRVESLGFCLPTTLADVAARGWSGTLWRVGANPAAPGTWEQVGVVAPLPGSLGAEAAAPGRSVSSWPAGSYVLEARFGDLASRAWLGFVIEPAA